MSLALAAVLFLQVWLWYPWLTVGACQVADIQILAFFLSKGVFLRIPLGNSPLHGSHVWDIQCQLYSI